MQLKSYVVVLLISPVRPARHLMLGIIFNPFAASLMILHAKVAGPIADGTRLVNLAALKLQQFVAAQVQTNGTVYKNYVVPVLRLVAKPVLVLTNGTLFRKHAVMALI